MSINVSAESFDVQDLLLDLFGSDDMENFEAWVHDNVGCCRPVKSAVPHEISLNLQLDDVLHESRLLCISLSGFSSDEEAFEFRDLLVDLFSSDSDRMLAAFEWFYNVIGGARSFKDAGIESYYAGIELLLVNNLHRPRLLIVDV